MPRCFFDRVWFANATRALFAGMLACLGAANASGADEDSAERPDKSQYNLFNPTPEKYMREMSPDRPDKTDSPYTLDAGHFQLEMDFANYTLNDPNSERGNVRYTSFEAAPMNLKVGLLNNVDVGLAFTSYRWDKTENLATGVTERDSGFAGFIPRCKVNLVGNDGGDFAMGLIGYALIPVGQSLFTGNNAEGGLGIPFAFGLADWDLGLQTSFGAIHDGVGDGYHADFANSVTLGHQLIGRLSGAVEFFSSVSNEQGQGWVGTVDLMLNYQANKNLRFDAGVFIGVTPAADDWHFWTGMTWRF